MEIVASPMSQIALLGSLSWAGEQEQEPVSIEEAFAHVLGSLMKGDICAEDAVARWEEVCRERAEWYSSLAHANVHDPVGGMHNNMLAQSLLREAATWKLIRHLFDSKQLGVGPTPVAHDSVTTPQCGQQRSLLQHQLSAIAQDAGLRRVAQVVAWLEELAGHSLGSAGPGAPHSVLSSHFAAGQNLWNETAGRLQRAFRTDGLVDSVDPDATTRGDGCLTRMDLREEERLLEAVWALMRAGRSEDALALCGDCGAAWRAASLAAGGYAATIPVGQACGRSAELDQENVRQGSVAADVLAGRASDDPVKLGASICVHNAWRLGCHSAAQSACQHAAVHGNAAAAATWEEAIYSTACGNVEGALRVCRTWEDELWARARCILQVQPTRLIESEAGGCLGSADQSRAKPMRWSIAAVIDKCNVEALPVEQRGGSLEGALTEGATSLAGIFNEMAGKAESGALAPHQACQRSLILAACSPLRGPADADAHHPFTELLRSQLLARPAASSPELADGSTRFAAHLGLALVALGAIPSDPGSAGVLWHQVDASGDSELLEACNELLGDYIDVLVSRGLPLRYVVPQYMCLQRSSLTHAMLRRYMQHITPRLPEEVFAEVEAASRALLSRNADQAIKAEHEPAHPALALLNAPQEWADCRVALSDMLQWFHFWRGDAAFDGDEAMGVPGPPAPGLPRTPVQLDDVLCVGVAQSRGRVELSALDKVAVLKWLLLPYDARKHLRRPFSSSAADDDAAVTCWACAIKAVFHAADLCREFCLQGAAARWAALGALDHVLGMSAVESAGDGDAQAAREPSASFLQHVYGMLADDDSADTELLETYQQIAAVVDELQQWHAVLQLEARMARVHRSVCAGGTELLTPDTLASIHADLAALMAAPLLQPPSSAPPPPGFFALQLVLAAGCGDAEGGGGVWGSHAAVLQSELVCDVAETRRLAQALGEAVNARLQSSPAVTGSVTLVPVVNGQLPEQPGVDAPFPPAQSGDAVISVMLCHNATGAFESEEARRKGQAASLSAMVSTAADILRADLPHIGSDRQKATWRLLSASCPWPQACITSSEHVALQSIHKAHVQGCEQGRNDALHRVCGLIQRSELLLQASRLHMWASQAGCRPATEWQPDDATLEMLGSAQLEELLTNQCAAVVSAHTIAGAAAWHVSA